MGVPAAAAALRVPDKQKSVDSSVQPVGNELLIIRDDEKRWERLSKEVEVLQLSNQEIKDSNFLMGSEIGFLKSRLDKTLEPESIARLETPNQRQVKADTEMQPEREKEYQALRSKIMETAMALPLQEVRAFRVALQSKELSEADRKRALESLERREQQIKQDIDSYFRGRGHVPEPGV